jgi:hypothetical protein
MLGRWCDEDLGLELTKALAGIAQQHSKQVGLQQRNSPYTAASPCLLPGSQYLGRFYDLANMQRLAARVSVC